MNLRWMMLLAAATGLGLCDLARGSVSYSYMVQPLYPIANGGITLNLYLEELSTAGSFQAVQDGGLYAAGVALVQQRGGLGVVTFTTAGVSNNSEAEPNGFSGNNTKGLVTSGGAWVADITSNSASKGLAPVSTSTDAKGTTTSLYLLGSMMVGVQGAPPYMGYDPAPVASFLVESLHDAPVNDGVTDAGSNGNTLTYNSAYDLDQSGAMGAPGAVGADGNPTFFTLYNGNSLIQPIVPEPASISIFGFSMVGLLRRRRTAAEPSCRFRTA